MNLRNTTLFALVSLLLWSCGEPEFPVPQASSLVANFSYTSGDDFAPDTVSFVNETLLLEGYDATYAWSFGDGTSATDANPEHVYTEPGAYTVRLVATTSDDVDYMERQVVIRDPNALQVRLFFMDAGDFTINEADGGSFSVAGFGTGLEYDAVNDWVYWTDADAGTLNRAALDGSGAEVVATGMGDIRDVALDVANDRAYVADRTNSGIWEITLSTGTTAVLYDAANDGLGELPVGLDYYNGNLYITCVEIDAEAVWVGGTDGSGVTRIIDYAAGGYGYGIAIDKVNEVMYFDDTDSGTILKANLDGSNIQQVLETGNRAYGLAVDAANGKLYYSERNSGNVYMANLDGSNIIVVASGYTDPRGLFFIP